jgi:hypothetical protein
MTVSSLTAGAGQLGSWTAGQLDSWAIHLLDSCRNLASAESWTDNSWRVAESCIEGQQNNCRELDR